MQVVDHGEQREVLVVLDDAEPEAIPLQRVGRGQNQVTPFGLRQHTMFDRGKTDIPGILDGVASDIFLVFVFEPAVVSPVSLKVGVQHVSQGADIATAGHVPGAHDEARII